MVKDNDVSGIGTMDQPLVRESESFSDSRPSNLEEVSSPQIGSSSHDASNSEKTRSCRSDELKKIKDQLTSEGDLKVVTIVGMGGIGKTTLATSIYEDIDISNHFHLRGWITVSQEYKLKNLLLDLLKSMDFAPDNVCELDLEELAHKLSKCLRGWRFLIVLDDMWNAEVWNEFKLIFPDDKNGSRVILTSRHADVATCIEPNNPPHFLNCLSNEESWRLLQNEVFVGKTCPSDLVKIGREIAEKCRGLPLAMVVVTGHLSRIDQKYDCWADVAKRLDSIITGNQETILDILCLSYNYLPLHLKACFLYMGIFPKSSEIHVLRLIRMLSAVGFLDSEDEVEKCLKDLINRNLITVRKKKDDGTAKTCGIHDLLWDLSLREAQKEGHYIFNQSNLGHYQFCATTDDDMKHLMDLTSTYRYFGYSFDTDFPYTFVCNCFRRLKVLDIQSKGFHHFPEIISLEGLRCLELSTDHIPESVSRLQNLETLIIRSQGRSLILPWQIWLLHHLRHLQVENGTFFLNSPATVDSRSFSAVGGSFVPSLPRLQTLSKVNFDSRIDQLFPTISNLKQLKICDINGEEDENLSSFLNSLVCLHRLEKLNLYFSKQVRRQQQQIPWCDFFPPSLKQLTLKGSKLQWEDMNILAMLPNIEVLKLKVNAFKGPVYEQTVEGFPKLKVLLFEGLNLEQWIAETDHYPILQRLVMRDCFSLKEIPYCFAEIITLEYLELSPWSESAMASARTIRQEQLNLGNYDFQVRISLTPTEWARKTTALTVALGSKGLTAFLNRRK